VGLVEAAGVVFPEARWQRCVVHCYGNAYAHVPRDGGGRVDANAIHASESCAAANATAERCGSSCLARELTMMCFAISQNKLLRLDFITRSAKVPCT
jgi:putative transposase